MAVILALDNGTQSVRALLFDESGTLIHKVRVPLIPYVSPRPGWAEHDVEDYWAQLCLATQRLWREGPIAPEAIAAVALTTQRNTVIAVDRKGNPLRPAIVWLDQRRTEGLPPLRGPWGLLFRLLGLQETIAYFQAEAESNWLATYQPALWRQTYKLLFLSGYLTFRLTGRFVDSVGAQVGYVPFDYKRLRWASSHDWKWQVLPIRHDQLPELLPPTEVLGTITAEAAEATGIPRGIPLIAAAADKACEVIGSGALEPSIAALSYGTTATINVTSRRYREPIPLIPPYPSAVPGAYNLEVQIYRGYWLVEWFKKEFGAQEVAEATRRGIEPEALFDELVEAVPPGSLGLTLQPYWSPGVRLPGPEAKGAVIGFGDVHTRAHFYRAIIEGVAYALREGKERIERRTRVPVRELRVSGGGSQSDAALQITADIFGLVTRRPHTHETAGLGAAIDAAVGLGLYPDFESAIAAMTHIGATFQPNVQRHRIYEALYRRVYRQMYRRLRPLYEAIREITGYP